MKYYIKLTPPKIESIITLLEAWDIKVIWDTRASVGPINYMYIEHHEVHVLHLSNVVINDMLDIVCTEEEFLKLIFKRITTKPLSKKEHRFMINEIVDAFDNILNDSTNSKPYIMSTQLRELHNRYKISGAL